MLIDYYSIKRYNLYSILRHLIPVQSYIIICSLCSPDKNPEYFYIELSHNEKTEEKIIYCQY